MAIFASVAVFELKTSKLKAPLWFAEHLWEPRTCFENLRWKNQDSRASYLRRWPGDVFLFVLALIVYCHDVDKCGFKELPFAECQR